MSASVFKKAVRNICKSNTILDVIKKVRNASVWSQDRIVSSPFKDVEIPKVGITEYVWENLGRWPDKVAMICGITGRNYTYHDLYKGSRNLAARLRRHFKIGNGEVICVLMPNLPEYPIAVLGSLESGAVVTTINPIYTAHEISRQLELSKAKVIIADANSVKTIREALQLLKQDLPVICVEVPGTQKPEGVALFSEMIAGNGLDLDILKSVELRAGNTAFLPYSSGTTGLPKGVELTNFNVIANCCQQNDDKLRQYSETTKTHQDSLMVVLPMFHIYGLVILMLHKLSVGCKLVTVPKFQSDSFLQVLEDHQITMMYGAPPIVLFLGTHPSVKPNHLTHFKIFMCAAAPLPLADVHKLLERAQGNIDFLQGYGLTETSPLVTLMVRGAENYGSIGYAIPNTNLRIVDSNLQNLGPNEAGELLVQGPQVMKGYKDNIKATNEALIEGHWFKTGDLAKFGEDGAVYILDRLKELIKVKGFQVPPAELEGILKEHPSILDAAVIAKPHARHGEVPKAFIVKKEDISEDEIKKFVDERVAEYKRIHDIVFIDSLPKNPSGKILRRVLKEM